MIKINNRLLVLIALCFTACAQTPPTLFRASIDVPTTADRRLQVSVKEVERAKNYSIMEVEFAKGGAVATSMFLLRSDCALMELRGERYFHITPLEPKRSRVTFQRSPEWIEQPGVKPTKVFTYEECKILNPPQTKPNESANQ